MRAEMKPIAPNVLHPSSALVYGTAWYRFGVDLSGPRSRLEGANQTGKQLAWDRKGRDAYPNPEPQHNPALFTCIFR